MIQQNVHPQNLNQRLTINNNNSSLQIVPTSRDSNHVEQTPIVIKPKDIRVGRIKQRPPPAVMSMSIEDQQIPETPIRVDFQHRDSNNSAQFSFPGGNPLVTRQDTKFRGLSNMRNPKSPFVSKLSDTFSSRIGNQSNEHMAQLNQSLYSNNSIFNSNVRTIDRA